MNKAHIIVTIILIGVLTACSPARPEMSFAYQEFPLGSIKPQGWLKEQLILQRDNVSANLDETYPEVMGASNGWLGGDGDQWERGPYWIDGLLPLAYVLDDGSLKEKVKPWVEWALTSQREDGNFGPTKDYTPVPGIQRTNSLDWWPRMVVLKILQQHYNATQDQRVIPFLEKYFHYQLSALKDTPINHWTFWAGFRHGDEMVVLLWLYNITKDPKLLELADLLHEQGFDFVRYFNEEGISSPGSIHCVNLIQGMKEPMVYWSYKKDGQLVEATDKFFNDYNRFIGYPSGMFGGDESLRDNEPTRGSELCSAVEFMYSLEELIKISGSTSYADHLERIAFNALPAQMSKDYKLHQYFQQANQISISMGDHNFSSPKEGTANLMGFLTGYPCCLSNLHQGWPKFTQNLWLRSTTGGIAAMIYAPSVLETDIDGAHVVITEDTLYPKSDEIVLSIKADKQIRFPLTLRIPSWTEGPSITINGEEQKDVIPGETYTVDRVWGGTDTLRLRFPMKVFVSRWYENSAAIERGPLVYALDVKGKWEKKVNTSEGRYGQEYWEVTAISPWNYSLVHADLANPAESFQYQEDGSILARAARIPVWTETDGNAGPMPYSPIERYGTYMNYTKNHGLVETIRLVPYAETTLRISEFPVVIKQ